MPKHLELMNATSFSNEIRFYITENLYAVAKECEDDKKIEAVLEFEPEEDDYEEENCDDILDTQAEIFAIEKYGQLKNVPFILTKMTIFLLTIIATIYFTKSILFLILIGCIVKTLVETVCIAIALYKSSSESQRNKHTAEHMMVNYYEDNYEMPKNVEDVRKKSRFHMECGTFCVVYDEAEKFVFKTLSLFFAYGAYLLVYEYMMFHFVGGVFIFIAIYFSCKDILKRHISDFTPAIDFVAYGLSYIGQVGATSRKNNVNDKDIYIAYLAARLWWQLVYKLYYDKSKDPFIKDYFEKVNKKCEVK